MAVAGCAAIMAESKSSWYLYMLRCHDGSLYTGISTDVERRLREHRATGAGGRGAKILRGKQPLTLVFKIQVQNRSEAQQLEYTVKQLTKTDKEALVEKRINLMDLVGRSPME